MQILIDALETMMAFHAKSVKRSIRDLCSLESSDGPRTLITSDGSLVTTIRLKGIRSLVGEAELEAIIASFRGLKSFMGNPGHGIEFWFGRDPDRSGDEIDRFADRLELSAKAADIDLDDLINEKRLYLRKFLSWEDALIGVWTRPTALIKEELSKARKRQMERQKHAPRAPGAQKPWIAIPELREKHQQYVFSISELLGRCAMDHVVLDAHEALNVVRGIVYPSLAKSDWRPMLPGDRLRMRLPRGGMDWDVSSLLWPPIADQLFMWEAERLDKRTVQIGDRIFSSIDIELLQDEFVPFAQLIARLWSAERRIPWRIRFLIEGNGLKDFNMKILLAGILPGDENKLIKEAFADLRQIDLHDDKIVKIRISLCTWAPKGELEELELRRLALQMAVEKWGGCQVIDLPGDILEGVMSSVPIIDCSSTANPGAMPMTQAFAILPLSRPASAFDIGSALFRSPDGRMFPHALGSSDQNFWVDLIFSPPGGGKSVLLNTLNLGYCLTPRPGDMKRLPRLALIDIGVSGSGLISVLKDALPPTRRHEAGYFRMKMAETHAINPFDTSLGCRTPLPIEVEFIRNILKLVCMPEDSETSYDGMSDLIGAVVEYIYDAFSDQSAQGRPKQYNPDMEKDVDIAVSQTRMTLDAKTSWWEVTDYLFKNGFIHEASLAQRHAVPVLKDCISAARAQVVADMFKETHVSSTQESLIGAFQRKITGAIKKYPVLSSPTRFDIGDARICVLDLDDVAPKMDAGQTCLMYMLARHAAARDYFLIREDAEKAPKLYQEYHRVRIEEIQDNPKRLAYDEFHRTEGSAIVRDQVKIDIRQGRKSGIQLVLVSQLLDDFDAQMVDQATAAWVLGSGSAASVRDIVKTFDLNGTGEYVIRNLLTGPSWRGAPLFVQLKMKGGKYNQFLYNTIGPVELWAFSTSARDVAIRRRLSECVGTRRARELLAKNFPGGSAEGEIRRRITALQDNGAITEDAQANIYDQIVDDIVNGKLR
jgi:intracellular multiplication protein IcmB